MANLGRQISNNNGSQLAALRAVKHDVDSSVLKSDLPSLKEKQLSDDIISKLSEKLNMTEESLGEYLLGLNSATIDSTLARIVDVIKKSTGSSFTDEQLSSLKEAIAAVQASQPEAESSDQSAKSIEKLTSAIEKLDKAFQSSAAENSNSKKLDGIAQQLSGIASAAEQARIAAEKSAEEKDAKVEAEQPPLTLQQIKELLQENRQESAENTTEDQTASTEDTRILDKLDELSNQLKSGTSSQTAAPSVPVEKSGSYSSVTPASNFSALQQYIALQFQSLNSVESQIHAATLTISDGVPVVDVLNQVGNELKSLGKQILDACSSISLSPSAQAAPIEMPEHEAVHIADEVTQAISTSSDIDTTAQQALSAASDMMDEAYLAAQTASNISTQSAEKIRSAIDVAEEALEHIESAANSAVASLDQAASSIMKASDTVESAANSAALQVEESSSLLLSSSNSAERSYASSLKPIDEAARMINESSSSISSLADSASASISKAAEQSSSISEGIMAAAKNAISQIGIEAVSSISSLSSTVESAANAASNQIGKSSEAVNGVTQEQFETLNVKIDDVKAAQEAGFAGVRGLVAKGVIAAATFPLKVVGSLLSSINPFKRKKKKKKTPEEMQLAQMITKVNDFIDHFFERMLGYVDAFLDRVLKSAKKIVSSLMMHIFKWILINVGMLGAIFAIVLTLIADPLKKLLEPILKCIDGIVDKISAVIISALDFLRPVRDFIINVLSAVWKIIEVPLKAFFEGLAPFAKAVAEGLGLFVKSVLNVLKLLMDGIASGAEKLGRALVTFATNIVDVLALFMKGLSTQAEAIGAGLGRFVTSVLNVLALLMEGLGTKAKEIGEAVGTVVVSLVTCVDTLVRLVTEVGEILIDIARIIHSPIKILADFLDGIGSKARDIGVMISETIYNFFKGFASRAEEIGKKIGDTIVMVLDIILAVLTPIKLGLENLQKLIRLYIIAPLAGLSRKITGLKVKLAKEFAFEVPVLDFHGSAAPWKWEVGWKKFFPFSFLTGGMSEEQKTQALKDADTSTADLVNEEMSKVRDQLAAEDAAAKQAALAAQIEQKKIADLVNNVHEIKDIKNILEGTVLTKLDTIIENMKVLFEHFSLVFEEIESAAASEETIQTVQPEVIPSEVAAPQISKANTTALAEVSKPQSSEELDKTAAAAAQNNVVSEGKSSKFNKQLMAYLSQMSTVMSSNFDAILQKLDDKPSLLPMPMISSPNANNLASMENLS